MSSNNSNKIGVPSALTNNIDSTAILNFALSSNGLTLLACCAILGIVWFLTGRTGKAKTTKGVMGDAEFGGNREMKNAEKVAKQQMEEKGCAPVAGYNFKGDNDIFFPDLNRSILCLGAASTGKTSSYINPILMSQIDQGHPILLYDFKFPDQASILATYAAINGYQIDILAPGREGSGVINPITEFIEDGSDSLHAGQLAAIFNANFARQGGNKGKDFFDKAGDATIKGTMMMARGSKHPDLITCSNLLSLPKLGGRIGALTEDEIDPWQRQAFNLLVASTASEATESSICTTAQAMFAPLVSKAMVNALCGETTINTKLEGKRMLILGLDQNTRNVLAPLFASMINMIVLKNMEGTRKDPFVLGVDELATLYIPEIQNWPNEYRSRGLCIVTGIQNKTQVEKLYGEVGARTLIGAHQTGIFLSPGQDPQTAEWVSKLLGEKEVLIENQSSSKTSGKTTLSYSMDSRARPLISATQIIGLGIGNAIITGPHFADKKGKRNPIIYQFKMTKQYKKLIAFLERTWEQKLYPVIIKREKRVGFDDQVLRQNMMAVKTMLPDSLLERNNNNPDTLLSKIL